MLSPFGKYLEFKEFAASHSVLRGAVRPVVEDGRIRFLNALTQQMHDTFEDASEQANRFGFTGAQGTRLRGSGPEVRLEFLKDLDKVARQRYGDDVSVDLLSFNLTGEKAFLANKILREQDLIMAEDDTVARALRVRVGKDRILTKDEVAELARKANYPIGFDASKYGKRMKMLLAEKQIHFNVYRGQHTMAIFDPLAVLNPKTARARKLAQLGGWDQGRFAAEIKAQVEEAYGKASKGTIIDAIGGMEEVEPEDLRRVAVSQGLISRESTQNVLEALQGKQIGTSQVKKLLTEVRTEAAALKAFDGQALINVSLVNSMADEVRGKIAAGGLTGSNLKIANRVLRDLTDERSGGIFNVRATGFQVKEVFGGELGEQLSELVLQAKGNFLVTQSEVIKDLFGKDYGLVVPGTNIHKGVAGKAVGQTIPIIEERGFSAILTAEPQKGKGTAFFDLLTPGTGSDAITKKALRIGAQDLREGLLAVRDAAEGKPIDHMSRPYNIFKDSIFKGLEGENLETIAYYEDLFARMESGKPLPSTEIPVLIERFKGSLTRKHFDTDVPRIPLPWTERTYAVSSIMARFQSGGASDIVKTGYAEIGKGMTIFSDTGVQESFHALGGFDLDDAINVTYKKGTGEFEAILYRQPSTTEEFVRVKVQNVHKSEALKNMLSRDDRFKRRLGLLEEVREQIFDDEMRLRSDIRFDELAPRVADTKQLGLGRNLYRALEAAIRTGDLEEAADIIDRRATTRLMEDAAGILDEVNEELVARGMSGSRFKEVNDAGDIRFPGVSRNIGGEAFEFNYKQLFDVEKRLIYSGVEMDALARIQAQAPNASLLGEWVNAKGTLGMWLEINKEKLENLRGTQAQEVLEFLRKADFYMEESVIDALVQGRGLSQNEATKLKDSIRHIWEEQTRLTMEIEGLQMEEYMVKNRMPGYLGTAKDELLATEGKLGKGLPTIAMEEVTSIRETVDEFAETARANIFKGVEVSEATKRHASAIFDQLNEISNMEDLSDAHKEYLQKITLERRFYESFSDGKFGQEAADLFVALSKDQRYAGTVRGLKMGVAAQEFIEGGARDPLAMDAHFQRIGRFIMPTKGFSEKLREVGLAESSLSRLADAAWGGVSATQEVASVDIGASTLYFDAERRLLPQSVIATGDEIAELGTILTGSEEQLAQVSESLAPRVREMAEELASVSSPAKATPWMTAAQGDEIKRGGLFRQLWSDLRPGHRRGIKGAAAGVAAAMLYNAKRDRDYTEEKIGPPRDMPEQYNQGLALSGATAASIQNTFGTTYDIRTRGGGSGFGDDFLKNLATITGGEVYVDTYRDPHQYSSPPSLRETIGDWIL